MLTQLSKSQYKGLAALLPPLLLLIIFLQVRLDDPVTGRRQPAIEPPTLQKSLTGLGSASLPFEYMLGAVSGFRQIIAGLLWVRSDSLFHSGNYDGILPLIRLITWLDPNWLDPYATGAWHLTYNFTDTDQRSDRRYLPAGVALLNEGIKNNPDLFDLYKEKGWLYYDKFKNFEESAKAYADGMNHNPDVTQIGHALAHAYERNGQLDEAEKAWETAIELHKKFAADPKSSADLKSRSDFGVKNATKNLQMLRFRRKNRVDDIKPPVDLQFTYTVTRVKPRVIEVKGTANMIGSRGYDVDTGIMVEGPVDGVRCDVQLQDKGYQIPPPGEFTFDLPTDVTLMKEQISIKGGRVAKRGGLINTYEKFAGTVSPEAEKAGVYAFKRDEAVRDLQAIPIGQALASNKISPWGLRQLVSVAYPVPYNSLKPIQEEKDVPGLVTKLKGDSLKVEELTKKGYMISQKDTQAPSEFKREIDMSKDPKMYGFAKDEYELILWINPRYAPDFFKDRVGFSGEGLKEDQRFLDTSTVKNARIVRVVIPLKKEDILGDGKKVIATSDAK
ncbi:MAG: tetratricopeptide repeat protein [Capsulimonadales bacterium]|nr:tetratricopeptide repeat protein [Capsulimonadales bacterium]